MRDRRIPVYVSVSGPVDYLGPGVNFIHFNFQPLDEATLEPLSITEVFGCSIRFTDGMTSYITQGIKYGDGDGRFYWSPDDHSMSLRDRMDPLGTQIELNSYGASPSENDSVSSTSDNPENRPLHDELAHSATEMPALFEDLTAEEEPDGWGDLRGERTYIP